VSDKTTNIPEAADLALYCQQIIDAGKADNILQLEVTELSVLADYFILCTGNSDPQIKALSERLKREVSKKYGFKPRFDGTPDSQWIVMDFGNVVVHILSPEMRDRYQLETLWGDAPATEHIERLANLADKAD